MIPETQRTSQLLTHAKALRALAQALVADHSAAEDLVQDTMVLALESAPQDGDRIGGWLRGVLRQKALHRHRSNRSRAYRERQAAEEEALPATVDLVARKAQVATLVQEVLQLKEPYQTVLYLRFFEEKRSAAIARELGIPEGTVASQVHRGLELLRSNLDHRSAGDRSVWVGALMPWFSAEATTKSATLGGAWMAGALKLGGTATVLAAVLFYVGKTDSLRTQELPPVPEPDGSKELLSVASNRQVSVPPPVRMVEDHPAVSTEPPLDSSTTLKEKSVARASPPDPGEGTEPAPGEPVQASPGPEFPSDREGVTVRRLFEFIQRTSTDPAKESPIHIDEKNLLVNFDSSSEQRIEVEDRFQIPVQPRFPTFQRSLVAKWNFTGPNPANPVFEEAQISLARSSPLSGRTQIFRKHRLEDRYAVSLASPQEGDQEQWTEGLSADLDLLGLCPPPGIGDGQDWKVSLASLRALFMPGGNLHVTPAKAVSRREDLTWNQTAIPINEEIERQSRCAATSRGWVATQAGHLLHFDLRAEFQWVKDFAESDAIPLQDLSAIDTPEVTDTYNLRGSGRWDPDAQRVIDLELKGEHGRSIVVMRKTPNEMCMKLRHEVLIRVKNMVE